MGADQYCSCFNKEPQGNEASLARKPDSTVIANKANEEMIIEHNSLNEDKGKGANVIDSSRQGKRLFHNTSTMMSSIVTDHLPSQNINYDNGDNYNGKIFNNKREGKGKLTFAMGGYYNGEFHDDFYEGYGTLCTQNTIYHGHFVKGQKVGEGKSENIKEGTQFIGNWESNAKNGLGKEIYSDGTLFEGNFINGLKKGKGTISLPNGFKYSGELANDTIEGKGTFIWDENRHYSGEWKNNYISGFGIMNQEKERHIGYYDHDKKNGLGLNYFNKSKSFILGKWTDDNLEGLAIYYMPNRSIQQWQMANNKLVSYYKSYTEIVSAMTSKDYLALKEYFNYLKTSGLIADLNINDTFTL